MADDKPSFTPGRRWSVGFNVVVAILALSAVIVMANYLASRHFQRFQWTSQTRFQLTPLTQRLLQTMTNDVKVVVFFDKENEAELYSSVDGLLREYRYAYPRMTIETVDYLANAAEAQLIKAKYNLNAASDKNLVIFDSNGRTRIVYQSELSEYDYSELMAGTSKEVRRIAFKGELHFTSALISLMEKRQLKACFLQGHGEHNPTSDEELMGYSKFAQVLKEKNIVLEPFRFTGTNNLPADCQLLIIAGPQAALLEVELERIENFLENGGRLLLLFNYQSLRQRTGLENLVAKWDIQVGMNVVADPEATITQNDILISKFASHPVTKPLVDVGLYMLVPRSVTKSLGSASKGITSINELIFTTEAGFTKSDIRNDTAYFNPARDQRGQIPLAIAVEKGGIQGVSADRGSSRLLVIGDSVFFGNQTLDKAANREFASQSVNWLLDRNLLLGEIGPRPIRQYKLTLSNAQLGTVRWILLGAMPGGILLLGGLVWLRRRS